MIKNTCILLLLCIVKVMGHIVTPEFYLQACKTLKENPNDIEALNTRGHYYFNMRSFELALKDLGKIQKLVKNPDIAVLITLAATYAQLHQYNKALALYKKILTKKNHQLYFSSLEDFCKGYWERAMIYLRQEKFQKAWQDVQIVLKAPPKDMEWSIMLQSAEIAEKAERQNAAISLYTKALIKFPNPACEKWLGRLLTLLIQKKSFAKCYKILDVFAKALADDPMPLFYKAMIAKYYEKNNALSGKVLLESLKRAQQMIKNDNQSIGFFWQSRIFLQSGKTKKALKAINRALKLESDQANFYRLRSYIHKILKNTKAAAEDKENYRVVKRVVGEGWIKLAIIPLPNFPHKKKKRLKKKK